MIVIADAPPVLAARGEACGHEQPCRDGLGCLTMTRGYCGSSCGVTGAACEGACVPTPHGELCLASCASDADCRSHDGYTCDPLWRACALPNTVSIVPRACPAARGIGRDPAFAPTTRLATTGVFQTSPAAAIGLDGSLIALYAGDAALGTARFDPLGRATLDAPFPAPRAQHFAPRLARDARGRFYATWLADDRSEAERGLVGLARGPRPEIAFATSQDGVTWSPATSVDDPADCVTGDGCPATPMVVAGGDVVYVMYGAEGLRVRASRDGGKSFGPAHTALVGGYGNATVGADGRLHVVAIDGDRRGAFGSANQRIQYTVSASGERSFARPITVSRRDEILPYYFGNPSIAVDTRRKLVYVAYVRGGRDAIWDIMLAVSRDGGVTWKRTRIGDDPACAIHMVPNLAVDPTTGTLHLAWYDSRGAQPRFAHAACTAGAIKCTQLGRINDVPFATLSTVRHGAAWVGDAEALVIDDKRRVLHAVWAQPVDDNGAIVSRIFHAKAKLPPR